MEIVAVLVFLIYFVFILAYIGLMIGLLAFEIGMIVFHIIVSVKFGQIAKDKGYKGYFWYVFFLGIAGILLIMALPDRNKKPTQYFVEVDGQKVGPYSEELLAQMAMADKLLPSCKVKAEESDHWMCAEDIDYLKPVFVAES